jgi:hypothetical protein
MCSGLNPRSVLPPDLISIWDNHLKNLTGTSALNADKYYTVVDAYVKSNYTYFRSQVPKVTQLPHAHQISSHNRQVVTICLNRVPLVTVEFLPKVTV